MPILLPTRNVEVEQHFAAWETSFYVRPCQAIALGLTCGHNAAIRAHGKCGGCEREEESVFLCAFHLGTYYSGGMAFHEFPCGLAGMPIILSNIERL